MLLFENNFHNDQIKLALCYLLDKYTKAKEIIVVMCVQLYLLDWVRHDSNTELLAQMQSW